MRKDYNLEKRKYVIGGFIVAIVCIFLVRLFNLQVADSKYKAYADSNAFLKKAIYPSRGIIYDRNGKVVVFNQPAYDVKLIPIHFFLQASIIFCRQMSHESLGRIGGVARIEAPVFHVGNSFFELFRSD